MKMSSSDYSHTETVHRTHKDARGNVVNGEAVGTVSYNRGGRVMRVNQWPKKSAPK